MAKSSPALRKRQKIAQANKMMFLWVAGASALISFAMVGSYFLIHQIVFNEKVLGEKSETNKILEANNRAVPDLQDNVRALSANELLGSAVAKEGDSPLQVVLDALPADGNSLAFGASLQHKLLSEVDGLSIESVTVDPVVGVEYNTDAMNNTQDSSSDSSTSNSVINFRLTVMGNDEALREALRRIESSIRPIVITDVAVESFSGRVRMIIRGYTYYEPAVEVELGEKTVTP